MPKNKFDLPNMDDLSKLVENAMEQAESSMEDLPDQMEGLEDIMGSLSSMMEGLPGDLDSLTGAIEGFSGQHEANSVALAGDPDWTLEADIQIGTKIRVVVSAAFDLKNVMLAWNSTQNSGFESLVQGVAANAGVETDDNMMEQIMGQLQKGRSIALVKDINVLECNIQGAPGDAVKLLKFSPEGNIPLAMDENGLGFEFSPMLTIKNKWDNADLPTFTPMAEEIVVHPDQFVSVEDFNLEFKPANQDFEITLNLTFKPL